MAFVLATLGLVVGATAGLLRGLDALPGYLLGEPREVKRYRTLEEVERKLGERVLLPAYFPDTLRWPPAAIRLASGPLPSLTLTFTGRDGGEERLILSQAVGGGGAASPRLLPPGLVLYATAVPVGGTEGELSRIKGEDGAIWHDLPWRREGRQVALRFRGPVEELLKMARSMRPG
jgi:hypothetical protein